MKKKIPLITIGIASYNAEKTIERSLMSAINQDYSKTEIIVVDDCSKDSTLNILKKYAKKYSKISIYKNKYNLGIGHTRNKIIQKAKGKYLAFFDDDDFSIPKRVSIQFERIRRYEKIHKLNICHSSRIIIYPNLNKILHPTIGMENNNIPIGLDVAKFYLLGEPIKNQSGSCATCTQMASVNTFKYINGFDGNFRRSEDCDLIVRLALKKCHFIGVQKPLVYQYMLKKDKSLKIELKYHKLLYKKFKCFISKHSNYEFAVKWLLLKYSYYKGEFDILSFFKLLITFTRLTLKRVFSFKNYNLVRQFSKFHEKK